MWFFGGKRASEFSGHSTAEQVTDGIDGSGLTAIVTGASGGLGAETTRVLALRGVHVIMAVRNTEAGCKIKDEIVKQIPEAKLEVMELDLSSLSSVRMFASEYKASNRPLNLLINNAGVTGLPFTLSENNVELQFATNYLGGSQLTSSAGKNLSDPTRISLGKKSGSGQFGFQQNPKQRTMFQVQSWTRIVRHFLLTNLLLGTMKQTARGSHRHGRIINVSSILHRFTYSKGIRFDKLNNPKGYSTFRAYGQSKLANILHTFQLSKHLKEDDAKITANSVHPGVISTDILRYHRGAKIFHRIIGKHFFKNIPQGAAPICYVALHPQVNGISGEYFNTYDLGKPSSQARDASLAQKLWDFSMDLVKNNQ